MAYGQHRNKGNQGFGEHDLHRVAVQNGHPRNLLRLAFSELLSAFDTGKQVGAA